jgi:hypothetical protein
MRLEELERLADRLRDVCRQVSMDPRNLRKREELMQMLPYAGDPLFGGAIDGRSPTINERVEKASAQAQILRQRIATAQRVGPHSFAASQATTAAGSLAQMLGMLLSDIRHRPPEEER